MPAEPASSSTQRLVVVSVGLQDLCSADVRLLEEAARLGSVHVRLWSDDLVASASGKQPKFPEAERRFYVANLRYVDGVSVVTSPEAVIRPVRGIRPGTIVAPQGGNGNGMRLACERAGIRYVEFGPAQLSGFPVSSGASPASPNARRVIVTGSFDWLHSGHVEFFREAASFGELYVVVGSDRNVRLLKGGNHPLRGQDERRYMVQAIRAVHRALISSGSGWMDAEPEIASIHPHTYVVNEDGDQSEKRDFCRAHGIEYAVLHRRPHRGLSRRTSTELRGF
jgi:cytidyltransferase-like protein